MHSVIKHVLKEQHRLQCIFPTSVSPFHIVKVGRKLCAITANSLKALCTLRLGEEPNSLLAAGIGLADIPTWAIAVIIVLGGVVLIITAILITSVACTFLRRST